MSTKVLQQKLSMTQESSTYWAVRSESRDQNRYRNGQKSQRKSSHLSSLPSKTIMMTSIFALHSVSPLQLSSIPSSLPGKIGMPPPLSYTSHSSQFNSLSTGSSSISLNQKLINSKRAIQFQYLLQGIPPTLSLHYELSSNGTQNPMLTHYSQDCMDHSINTGWQKNSWLHSSARDSTLLHT